MKIRQATRNDLTGIAQIASNAFSPFVEPIGRIPAPMAADFAAHLARGELIVLSLSERLAGYLVLIPQEASLLVDNLAIDPAFHGQGLARRLLDHAHQKAEKLGLAKLTLYTNELMHDAIGLYRHLGWQETGRRREAGFNRIYFQTDTQLSIHRGRAS